MARYGLKMAIYQLLFFGSSPNLHRASGYIWGHNLWPNQDLDPLSISKWPSEPQFCERKTHIWRKNGQKRTYKGHTYIKGHSFRNSLYLDSSGSSFWELFEFFFDDLKPKLIKMNRWGLGDCQCSAFYQKRILTCNQSIENIVFFGKN